MSIVLNIHILLSPLPDPNQELMCVCNQNWHIEVLCSCGWKWMLDFDKKARTADNNSRHESYQNDTRGHQIGQLTNEDLYRQSNMLPIVQAINKNKLWWFGHVMRREKESMLRVVKKLKKGKRPRGRPILRWLDNIDSHLMAKKIIHLWKKSSKRNVSRIYKIGGHWWAVADDHSDSEEKCVTTMFMDS